MIDLSGGRQLIFKRISACGEEEVLAVLSDGLVAMDGPAAGAGGKGEAHHGRIGGPGYSLVLDVAQAANGENRLGNISTTPQASFFDTAHYGTAMQRPTFGWLPSSQTTGTSVANAVKRSLVAAPLLAAACAQVAAAQIAGAAAAEAASAAAAAATESGSEQDEEETGLAMPSHCWYCASLETSGLWQYKPTTSGTHWQRWCNACNTAAGWQAGGVRARRAACSGSRRLPGLPWLSATRAGGGHTKWPH